MKSRLLVTCLVCIAAQCWLQVAWAQYFPELHPTERRAVGDGESLLVDWDSSVMKEIGAELGCDFWYVFRADASQRRMFAVYEGEDPEKCYNTDFTEYEVISSAVAEAATGYMIDGRPLYIGVGRYSKGRVGEALKGRVDDEQCEWDVLCSFVREDDGTAQQLDLVGAQAKFITDLYALDLTSDGLLDLACASTWGASGGGGIDFVTVQPDGAFHQFWPGDGSNPWLEYPPVIGSSLPSAYSVSSVHDFDANGVWEVETMQYLDYGGGMGSYIYNVLYNYDPQTGKYYPCTDEFPELYADQREFYEAFAQALIECEANPEPFKQQINENEQLVWEYEGQQYRISGFQVEPDDLLILLQSWDSYEDTPFSQ